MAYNRRRGANLRDWAKFLIAPLGMAFWIALSPLYDSFPWARLLAFPLACWAMSVVFLLFRSRGGEFADLALLLGIVGVGFLYFGTAWAIWRSIGVLILATILFPVIGGLVWAALVIFPQERKLRALRSQGQKERP